MTTEQLKNGCSVDGCTNSGRLVRGFCIMHYDRFRDYGDPLAGPTFRGAPERFYQDVVLKHEGDECLIWPFARIAAGYGQVTHEGRPVYVHRRLCKEIHGDAPSSKYEASHSCGRGHDGCVNRHHLSWKSRAENERDKVSHGTSNRGERQWQAKLTSDDVRSIRRLIAAGRSNIDIAGQFGVSPSSIRMIRHGLSWAWLDAPDQEKAS